MPAWCRRADHLLEFVDLAAWSAAGRVTAMGRKEAERVVSPVIGSPVAFAPKTVGRKLMDGHQLDRGHAQRLQVGDLVDHAQVSAGMLHATGRRLGKAADVHLVDHGFGQIAPQMAVALPIELVVHHHALGRPNDAVVRRQEFAGQSPRVGIDQPGGAIETLAAGWIERPVGLQMVECAGRESGDEDAPNVAPAVGFAVENDDFRGFAIGDLLVQQHAHGRGRTAKHDELHAVVVQDRPVGQGMTEL